jgi:hypothetical protein
MRLAGLDLPQTLCNALQHPRYGGLVVTHAR